MSKHYAILESLKVLPLLLAQSVDVLYSKEILKAPPTAEEVLLRRNQKKDM
jgi:hypothetical protein